MPQEQTFTIQSGFEGLRPISIPFFLPAEAAKSATVFSYLSIGLSLIFISLVLLWVLFTVRSAFQIITAQGDSKKVEAAFGKIRIIIGAIIFLFGFYIALALVGSFIGLGGNIFNWPKSLSICSDGTYYFQKYLFVSQEISGVGGLPQGGFSVDEYADSQCFGN